MRPQRGAPLLWWFLPALLLPSAPVRAKSLPDFMEHWEFGMDVNEDQGPKYFSDIILPVYRPATNQRVVFVEPRVTYRDREWLTNMGGGYRELVLNRSWLLGGNMFYDYESQYSHYRLGWGLEALSAYAEFRWNSYLGLSSERLVQENAGGNTYEKAVDGHDVEVGMPVPYYSRLKCFGGYNWYNYEHFKNRYGWTLRSEYTPWPFLVIDGLLSDSTKTNVDWGMKVALRIPFGGNAKEPLRAPLRLDPTAFPPSDVSGHLFKLVERHHDIVVERRLDKGSVSVEVRRGT